MNADRNRLNEICERVIGCAFAVANTLGAGFLEKVYENALTHELKKAGFLVQQQVLVKVKYDGIVVGDYVIDMLVNGKLIIELKASEVDHPVYKAQLINYLKATRFELGFLVNFGRKSLDFQRVVFTKHE